MYPTAGVEEALSRLSPHLAPLWDVLHARLSSGHPVRRVRIGPLDHTQRTAVADLFGLERLPGEFHTVGLARLDEILREIAGCDSRTAVEHLVGTIPDRAAERAASVTEIHRLWEWLSAHEVVRAQPSLASWAAAMRRNGLIAGSAERTRLELGRALQVLRMLPATGVHLPVFAQTVLGDPHALDQGSRVQAMVIRALTILYDAPTPEDAIGLRQLWARAGIADDELSSTVLAAGLPIVDTGTAAGRILRISADAGLATVLTLQQLRAAGRPSVAAEHIWVFENPSILASALARFGRRCPPMVCVSGWPSSAAVVLLDGVVNAGARLRYHGDLDGEGLRIAANLVARFDAVPWRMGAGDYLAAVSPGSPPVGRVTPVPWDGELCDRMREHGRSVPQESVVDLLLADIAP